MPLGRPRKFTDEYVLAMLEKFKWNQVRTAGEIRCDPRVLRTYVRRMRSNGIIIPKWKKSNGQA